jgi:HD-GYP domain-containing protein (c-di-GMP phosphodiesterase class II)
MSSDRPRTERGPRPHWSELKPETDTPREQGRAGSDSSAVGLFVLVVTSVASVAVFATAGAAWSEIHARPAEFVALALLALVLQVVSVDVYGRGSLSVAGLGFLAVGFGFGPGAAMLSAVGAAAIHAIKKRPKPQKAVFNVSVFALSACGAALTYDLANGGSASDLRRLGAAVAAGAVFTALNVVLLCSVMSLAERLSPLAIWTERFRWLTPHYLSFGPLAIAAVIAYERIGPAGVAAFAVPPALLVFTTRQYLNRTRESVVELRTANTQLSDRNADLQTLLALSSGLAARAHDRDDLIRHVERSLGNLLGGRFSIALGEHAPGLPLRAGGDPIGGLVVEDGERFDAERWERLSDALVPHLSTALESAQLVVEVRERHVATIAALSRSMEVKDGYTGGHTERVSDVAAALGRRLGYRGEHLDALEIGALLHDIGKIGIPERILHKPGPLDEEEWTVMKTHPVLSEHILSGIGLSPIVLQVARSSHERMDGDGYPDGLAGEEIPLPARIVLVADAFDALTSDRPYRKGRSVELALEEIRTATGPQFCERVVAALERVYREEPEILGATRLRAVV